MKVLSIINLKGGVAKTISSVNMAHILAAVHGCKVLLIGRTAGKAPHMAADSIREVFGDKAAARQQRC